MLKPLPPLNAVRAFEAAARHLSFTLAALELHVTHSAISRQIKHLESHLSIALFERKTRQVHLTEKGQDFYTQISMALEQISEATQSIKHGKRSLQVRINVRPSFAVRWLIPRLADFVARHPDIEPQVITSTKSPDQAADDFDIAIRRNSLGWPSHMKVQAFLEDEVMLVGSPVLFAEKPIKDFSSLSSHVLLMANSRSQDWDRWIKRIQMPSLTVSGHLQFEHLHFVMQAAIDGLGIALAPTSLIANDLTSGRLVSPFPEHRMALNRYYFCVTPKATSEVQSFVKWLSEQKIQLNAKADFNTPSTNPVAGSLR
jgi:LysR family transcriptional regulator, glycine cleavage system transcriptional activator